MEKGRFVVAGAGIDELVNGPESLVVFANSRVFEPVHVLKSERTGEDVEIAVTVHVVEVLGIVLHVVGSERQDLAERTLLEVGGLIPELAGGDVGFAVPVDVADGDAFVVVLVELLHAPLVLRSDFAISFRCRGCGESAEEEKRGPKGDNYFLFHRFFRIFHFPSAFNSSPVLPPCLRRRSQST